MRSLCQTGIGDHSRKLQQGFVQESCKLNRDRFVFYARLIRCLEHAETDTGPLSDNVYDTIDRFRADLFENDRGDLVPNLVEIDWKLSKDASISRIHPFLTPRLKSIYIDLNTEKNPDDTDEFIQLFRCLQGMYEIQPNQVVIGLSESPSDTLFSDALRLWIAGLPSLWFLRLFVVSFQGLGSFLVHERLTCFMGPLAYDSLEELPRILEEFVTQFPNLEDLTLNLEADEEEIIRNPITLLTLKPLLQLEGLRSLCVDGRAPCSLEPEDILKMGQTWGQLHTLSLCSGCDKASCMTPFNCIGLLTDAFNGRLRAIGLVIDCGREGVPQNSTPKAVFQRRLELCVGPAPPPTGQWVKKVVEMLSLLCLNGVTIIGTQARYAKAWKDIQKHVEDATKHHRRQLQEG